MPPIGVTIRTQMSTLPAVAVNVSHSSTICNYRRQMLPTMTISGSSSSSSQGRYSFWHYFSNRIRFDFFSGDYATFGGITSSSSTVPLRARSVSGSGDTIPTRRQPDILASAAAAAAKRRKMSLVGKPLAYKNYHTDQKFRRMQSKIHNFLERPRGWRAASYHLAV